MRLVVPALSEDNVAVRCLQAENLSPEVVLLHAENDYAQLLAALWKGGETFVIVEDDIAPWPGAIQDLLDCPHAWCGYHYCLPGRWDVNQEPESLTGLWGTTGCYKVAEAVMRAAPELYKRWETHDWTCLDVALTAALRHIFVLEAGPPDQTFHVHTPPVAHAMHYRPEAVNVDHTEVRSVWAAVS